MRPEVSPLDLNHSPKQTAVPDRKAWVPFPAANFYDDRTNWPPVATESSPTRSIKGGTSENEHKGGSDDFGEETEDPLSFTQPEHNWPAGRAIPHTSVPQVGSGLPWQITASQFDASNTGISASGRLEKRKRISESGEEEAANSKYKCRFCGQHFPKSQALGGHMNRHRQEREHEQLKHARELVEQQDQRRPGYFQNTDSSLAKFISRTPFSVASHIPGMQTHQQSNPYHATQLNWNPGASQNTPFALDPGVNNPQFVKPEDSITYAVHQSRPPCGTMFNPPYVGSQGRNQDTMPGMSYERNPAQQQQLFPSDSTNAARVCPSHGAGTMQRNYLPKQEGGSTTAVTDRRFNPAIQSPSSYPLQSGAPGSEFAGQGSETFQQFGLHSGFQLPSPSSNTPTDFTKAPRTPLDAQMAWLYGGSKSTSPIGSITNEQDYGLALVSYPMAFEGRMTGPSHNSQGTGIGQLNMEGESVQGRQKPGSNNIHGADSSSLSYAIDGNPVAEIESKYNQGLPKDP